MKCILCGETDATPGWDLCRWCEEREYAAQLDRQRQAEYEHEMYERAMQEEYEAAMEAEYEEYLRQCCQDG